MEGTLNRFSHDGPTAEVGPQVSALGIHDGDLPAAFSISHQLAAQNALGERLILQLAALAEQIPGGRIGGKRIRRWRPNILT
jgi:hypothetical protein